MASKFCKGLATLVACTLLISHSISAATKWQGQIPKGADNPDSWAQLLPQLMDHGMYYGALAGADSMLNFFSDLPSKQLAYSTIIELVDLGYPFSTRAYFVPGDIDPPATDNFGQSYLLYKGIVNVDKKMQKWADYYFSKIDKEKFPKYLFYQATEAYRKGRLKDAADLLKKVLNLTTAPEQMSLAKKAARNLARIHYELQEFDKSLEIYQSFLLKISPITPNDWLEAAWNQYQLKNFPEALGLLYNFESHAKGSTQQLERYVLRVLIYREYCSTDATAKLLQSFENEFGALIDGIKLGEPLSSFPDLVKIDLPETQEYRQFVQTLAELDSESKRISQLPSRLRSLARYLYVTEINMLKRSKQMAQDQAQEKLARHLVILGESLRFLQFDVAREKYNPDRVFAEQVPEDLKLVDATDEKNFRLHWLQWGDYWRDERVLYRGLLKNKCEL